MYNEDDERETDDDFDNRMAFQASEAAKAEAQDAKLFLNAFYGKFGQRLHPDINEDDERETDDDFDNRMAFQASEAAKAESDAKAEDETWEATPLTEAIRKRMGPDACAWYDSLTVAEHIQLRDAYIERVLPKLGSQISYEDWIFLESKLAVKFKGKEDRALRNTQRMMKRTGIR